MPLPAVSPSAVSDQSAPWLRWIVLAAVALAAMLVGAIATTVVLFSMRDGQPQPQNGYEVRVSLEVDVTAEQKGAVESALSTRYPADGVERESREEAWERFKELFKDQPDLIRSASPSAMPESFRVVTVSQVFDCAALAPVERMPGVDKIIVRQLADGRHPGAVVLNCP
ncbi:hypothetical protein C1I99_06880 [Micromonospora deserti]|uniref:FtsX extracellular domain-containing protein n=2 Tax=Micromonospora deserti TaxID=2070366 RepID=A0A2W2E9E7_9ACTN|nr:hypothetical protein C1I99_06880 [Micromonospora deserti]